MAEDGAFVIDISDILSQLQEAREETDRGEITTEGWEVETVKTHQQENGRGTPV